MVLTYGALAQTQDGLVLLQLAAVGCPAQEPMFDAMQYGEDVQLFAATQLVVSLNM